MTSTGDNLAPYTETTALMDDNAPFPTGRVTGQPLLRRAGADLGYLVAAFVLSLVGFVVLTVMFSFSLGSAAIVLGVVTLALTLSVAGGFATFQRALLATRGHHLAQPFYPTGTGRAAGLRRLRHAQSWRELLHALVSFVISVASFSIAISWAAGGLGGVTYWMWSRFLPSDNEGLAYLLHLPKAFEGVLNTALGALLLLTAPDVLHGLVWLHAGIARALLVDHNQALRQQVDDLASSRAAAGEAELTTLRRLERDLHDGPQQRLVRLGMDITTAQRRMDSDPAEARAILDEALTQSQDALAEIRSLSRGIAPPILTERGLAAAVTALAARGSVPTSVHVPDDVDDLLGATGQNAAYFVVAEALANVEKHAAASACSVELRPLHARVLVTVADNGVGGAALAKGHGLAGLADRLAGVDGSLHVSSPAGGPTLLTATIPAATDVRR